MRHTETFQDLTEALKVAVATLRERQVRFVLGGRLAAWARGGPEPQNDLDVMVKPGDAEAALRALADAGMRTERPPEEWLYKAWHRGVLIDVIFEPSGLEVTDEILERAETISLMAVGTPVMALEDVLVTMLSALNEHTLDYSRLVAIARALRIPRTRRRGELSPDLGRRVGKPRGGAASLARPGGRAVKLVVVITSEPAAGRDPPAAPARWPGRTHASRC